jgi:hypothetical protein
MGEQVARHFRNKKVETPPKSLSYEVVDYSYLLELVPSVSGNVEEVYTNLNSNTCKILEVPLKITALEFINIKRCSMSTSYLEAVTDTLSREVSKVLQEFYESVKGSLVVYSPLDSIEFANTVSNGWYLLEEKGVFTLHCNYRIFNEER